MKKALLTFFLLVIYVSNDAFSQNDSIEYDSRCYRETTTVKIENVEEFLYKDKKTRKNDSQIVFYVITGRFVEPNCRYYGEQMILVSIDTISLQPNKKGFLQIKGVSRQNTIRIGETYEFHLRLWGCVIYQLGPIPEFYSVNGVHLPAQICPHQPFRALELKGLNYNSISQWTEDKSDSTGGR